MVSSPSIGDRIRLGIGLTRGAFSTLQQEKWLFIFPFLYGITWVIGLGLIFGGIFVALIGAGYAMAFLDSFISIPEETADEVAMGIMFAAVVVFAFITASIATFFSAALVHSVGKIFEDEPTSIRDGIGGAWQSKRTILAWGGIGAVVSLIIRLLENRGGRASRVLQSLLGFAWSAMTFFIVPVIVFQNEGVRGSVSRSLEIFRQTWGEAAVVNLGIGLVLFPLIAIVGLAGIGAPIMLLENPESVLLITGIPAAILIGILLGIYQAATGIVKTALYYYATGRSLPVEFGNIEPDQLVSNRSEGKDQTAPLSNSQIESQP